ncbi:hypothetical protein [Croceitalea rosinachiae]|uniref:Uncharacterized protein n=1 Tax=Croceitalea rosinachiae TaxID=3075596 RepID=A0ABU3ACX2_9FLAO|nr:hypothetical protein [Croceitalea sp. F388]MDT0608034.1 hypothetical protein [Croceitalea sp. F388]
MSINNKQIVIIIAIGLVSLNLLRAQKSAPVAGDAATLIDLLKKDYSTVNPDNLEEVLSTDRSRVINIFKSYLSESQKKNELSSSDWFNDLLTKLNSDDNKFLGNYFNHSSKKLKKSEFKNIDYLNKLAAFNEAKDKLEELKRIGDEILSNETLPALYNSALNAFELAQKEYIESRFFKEYSDLIFIYKIYYDDTNTYLSKLLEKFLSKYGDIRVGVLDEYAEPNYQSSIQKSIPFLGGDLAFEAVIDGLSRFLAKRIKEELTVYVIKEIQENLNAPNPQSYLNELIVLLPRTADYLRGFEANQVLNFVDEIKQYIEDDFNHLLENAGNLRATPRFKKLIENNPDFDFAFEALELIPQLSKLKAPTDYFDYLSNSRNIARWATLKDVDTEKNKQAKFQLANGVRLVSMLAHSITYIDNGETKFVTTDVISDYASELDFYLLYVGFLHQQNIKYYNIDFDIASDDGELDFEHIMTEVPIGNLEMLKESKDLFLDELGKISENSNKVYTAALAIRKAKDGEEKVDFQKVAEFATSLIDMLEQMSLSADNILGKTNIKDLKIDLNSKLTPYLNIAKKSNEIVLDLHEKKFSNAIIKGIELTSSLKNDGVSLERILDIPSHIQNAPNAVLVSEFLSYSSIPKDTVRLNRLRLLKDQIKKLTGYEVCGVIDDLAPLKEAVKTNDDTKIINAIKSLKNQFDNNKGDPIWVSVKHFLPPRTLDNDSILKDLKVPEVFQKLKNALKEILLNDDFSCSDLNSLFAPIVNAIENEEMTTYGNQRTSLIRDLKKIGNVELVVNEIIEFNISQLVLTPLERLVLKAGIPEYRRADLTNSINKYTSSLLSKALINKEFDLKKLNTAEEVVAARQEMVENIQGVLPQLTTYLLRVKDENLIKVIHFVNDIALADNDEDVEAAIDAFALPSGSFSLKNDRGHFVAINSFPGILAGWEKPTDASADFALGFTAPIGLSTKICERLGLFVPIIDIAAPVRFRLDGKNDTKALSEFSFENILAPGLYLTYRFGESPFTLSAGFQFAPELAEIIEKQPQGEMQEPIISSRLEESVRYGLGVTIDIPLVTLYARKR